MYASKLAFNGCCFVDVLNRVDAKVKRCLLLDELVFGTVFWCSRAILTTELGFGKIGFVCRITLLWIYIQRPIWFRIP